MGRAFGLIKSWLLYVGAAVIVSTTTTEATSQSSSSFDPYQLNGGLVTAVAGRDFVILAGDTRLIGPGGYSIWHRQHVASRLWCATPVAASVHRTAEGSPRPIWSQDGSVRVGYTPSTQAFTTEEALSLVRSSRWSLSSTVLKGAVKISSPPVLPVLVGSAGCSADSEMLKRQVRADLRTALYFAESTGQVDQVAVLLSNTLYSRRAFPFYSFCVVAGLQPVGLAPDPADDRPKSRLCGHAYVYDAIGSYEQVAVACGGTGRELLQPILDRRFRTLLTTPCHNEEDAAEPEAMRITAKAQSRAWVKARRGTVVDCSKEEALAILVDAYRSVAEREVGVGDEVVFCTLQAVDSDDMPDAPDYECQVWRSPLKTH